MIAASGLRPAAAAAAPFVALIWLVAATAAAFADGYAEASWWLLLLNQLVLAPAAVTAALSLGGVVGGRAIGILAALLLAVVPALGVLYSLSGYRDTYVDVVLPEAAGIAAGGRWPAGVLSLVAAALLVRALAGDRRAAAAAGAAAGLAALAHPSGALVLVGFGLALAVAWRPGEAGLVALGALPGVAVAAVAYGLALDASWDAFTAHMTGLREYLWSNRVLQWLPLAGAIGAARGSLAAAALLAGWFGAFAFVYGASPNLSAEDGSYLVAFVPALPVLCLLIGCIAMLVPGVPRRLAQATQNAGSSARART